MSKYERFVGILTASGIGAAVFLSSCGGKDDEKESQSTASSDPAEESPAPAEPPQRAFWNELLLHKAIREGNIGYSGNGVFQINEQTRQPEAVVLSNCGVTNIEPLRGMPLKMLDLQGCPISNIAAVEGMPLMEFFLDGTNVEDLSPLEGNTTLQKLYVDRTNVKDLEPLRKLPLQELNLSKSRVDDIAALEAMPLRMLWLTGLPVTNIMPLRNCPLESLTLHQTRVEDLRPLANHRYLMRLHIGETPVRDLTPIAGLRLTRLVFTPAGIEKGIDEIRQMPMREIGTHFDDEMKTLVPSPAFWQQYDQGAFK